MAVPDEFADEISLSGPRERIAERLEAWRETPVSMLLLGTHEAKQLETMAELTFG